MYKFAHIGSGAMAWPLCLSRDVDVRAICDVHDKRRNDAIKVLEGMKAQMTADKELTPTAGYTDYREMLDKEPLDIVGIGTPHQLHAEMAVAALEAGCHVFCEKPMAVTLEECDRMVEAVRRTGRRLCINVGLRADAAVHTVLLERESGDLGQPYYVKSDYIHHGFPASSKDNCHFLYSPLLSFGSHPLDLILGILGEQASEVYAAGTRKMADPDYKFHDTESVLLKTADGRVGHCLVATDVRRAGFNTLQIYAPGCDVIQVENEYPRDDNFHGAAWAFWRGDGQRTVRTNLDLARPSGHTHADWGGHKPTIYKHAESLIMAIEHNVKPLTMADVVDGARAVAVALAAEESLRTGQPASVRQYAPLDAYDENAPQPGIDDYFGSVLGKYFYLQERGSLRTLLFA